MSNIGKILWRDLTVPNATEIKDFYTQVVGWTSSDHDMGDYADYNIHAADGEVIAGICHARGTNANVPPQWLVYVQVESVERSAEQCRALGGTVLDGPRMMGGQNFCVVQDPAGAVLGLMSEV